MPYSPTGAYIPSTTPLAGGAAPGFDANGNPLPAGWMTANNSAPPSMTGTAANPNVPAPAAATVVPTSTGDQSSSGFLGGAQSDSAASAPQAATGTTTPAGTVAPSTTVLQQTTPPGGNLYIEDLTDQKYIPNTLPLPISFRYGNNNVAQGTGKSTMSAQFHRDQSVIGAVFEQMYGGTPWGKHQIIDLTIRGDPYWLGQTNLDRAIQVSNPANPTYQNGVKDDVSALPIVFLHFRYPTTVGDDFVPVLSSNDVFNGLYEVNTVTSKFVDGAFKQTLRCIRHPMISNNMGNNSGSGTTTPPTSSAAPATSFFNPPPSGGANQTPTPVNASGSNSNTPITAQGGVTV